LLCEPLVREYFLTERFDDLIEYLGKRYFLKDQTLGDHMEYRLALYMYRYRGITLRSFLNMFTWDNFPIPIDPSFDSILEFEDMISLSDLDATDTNYYLGLQKKIFNIT